MASECKALYNQDIAAMQQAADLAAPLRERMKNHWNNVALDIAKIPKEADLQEDKKAFDKGLEGLALAEKVATLKSKLEAATQGTSKNAELEGYLQTVRTISDNFALLRTLDISWKHALNIVRIHEQYRKFKEQHTSLKEKLSETKGEVDSFKTRVDKAYESIEFPRKGQTPLLLGDLQEQQGFQQIRYAGLQKEVSEVCASSDTFSQEHERIIKAFSDTESVPPLEGLEPMFKAPIEAVRNVLSRTYAEMTLWAREVTRTAQELQKSLVAARHSMTFFDKLVANGGKPISNLKRLQTTVATTRLATYLRPYKE